MHNFSYETDFFDNNTAMNASVEKFKYIYWGAKQFNDFSNSYKYVHGYLASIICVFGVIANVVNILVLTRKNMQSSTNYILTAMAVADGLTMAAYFPFAIYFYIIYGPETSKERDTEGGMYFILLYVFVSVVVHSISIWLTVLLALFRFIYIKFPAHGAQICSTMRAKIAVTCVCAATTLACSPNFYTHNVIPASVPKNENDTPLYTVAFRTDSDFDKTLYNVTFWITAILIKILPCALLTILSILLIRCMRHYDAKRNKMMNKNKNSKDEDNNNSRDRKTNRTTKLLLSVVVLFLIGEFPQGILYLLTGVLPIEFHMEVVGPLGDLLDIISLFNNGINFILYCTMSKQFRETFIKIFLKPLSQKFHRGSDRGRFMLVSTFDNNVTAVTRCQQKEGRLYATMNDIENDCRTECL